VMETTKHWQATAGAAAFAMAGQRNQVVAMNAARTGFTASLALLPEPKLSITGAVRPVTATFLADEHTVRSWSPPV
jgi:hypothetical protein